MLGIFARDGAFAEFLSLPHSNLLEVPDSVGNDEAVFIEPLAAAYRILEQVDISPDTRVAVIGDGKLSQLISRVLALTGCDLTIVGKHRDKLNLLAITGARCINIGREITKSPLQGEKFDLVIEASGSPSGFSLAVDLTRPLGTIILKSTHHDLTSVDLSRIVVDEIKIIGSRCGRFLRALELLSNKSVDVLTLISARFPLVDSVAAISKASEPGNLKIIIDISE